MRSHARHVPIGVIEKLEWRKLYSAIPPDWPANLVEPCLITVEGLSISLTEIWVGTLAVPMTGAFISSGNLMNFGAAAISIMDDAVTVTAAVNPDSLTTNANYGSSTPVFDPPEHHYIFFEGVRFYGGKRDPGRQVSPHDRPKAERAWHPREND